MVRANEPGDCKEQNVQLSHGGTGSTAQPGTPKFRRWDGDYVNVTCPLVLQDLAKTLALSRLLMLGAFGARSKISGAVPEFLEALSS